MTDEADPPKLKLVPNNPIAMRMGRPKGAKDKVKRVRRPRVAQVEEIRDLTGNDNIVQALAFTGQTRHDKLAVISGLQTYIMGVITQELHSKDVARRQCWRDLLWTLHQMEIILGRERSTLAQDITPAHTNGARAVDLGDFKTNAELDG